MALIHAYLDDFNELVVAVSRRFYGGFTSGFYLSSPTGFFCECTLIERVEREGEILYKLRTNKEPEFGIRYDLYETHGSSVPIEHRFIVHTERFHKRFTYTKDDLGARYHKEYTDFALWAPTAVEVLLYVTQNKKVSIYPMSREEKGVYRAHIEGNLKNATYLYRIERNGVIVKSIDPYALSSNANGKESAVIDESELESIRFIKPRTEIQNACDAVIYECNIRDMTASDLTGTKTQRKFISLQESGTSYKEQPTGLDYLSSLGITHVQLQPILDFATVDEYMPERNYNWGYDPAQIITLDGSYASNPDNPYTRMLEFRKLVSILHSRDIRVVLDVVWNHMYSDENSPLGKCVPYYYFRYTESNELSNGSYCGNDLESRRPMMQHLLLYAVRKLMELYDIDGFRFDLMGILDIPTMNEITELAQYIKNDALVYGEGWDMPTALDSRDKTTIHNQDRTLKIGFFNDTFRDVLKGSTSDDGKYDKGFLTGSLEEAYDAYGALTGNSTNAYFRRFTNPTQSINAIETHDNATAWDKMRACCDGEPRELRIRRQKMMIACTLFAQGVPFIHAGFEFCATKHNNSNSYMAGDEINAMNWERRFYNQDIVAYTKKCIALRRSKNLFRLSTSKEIEECVKLSVVHNHMILYELKRGEEHYIVVINPVNYAQSLHIECGCHIIFDDNGNYHEEILYDFEVPTCSIFVLAL